MTTRKRADWPKKLVAAKAALKPLRPGKGEPPRWALRGRDGIWRDEAGKTLPTDGGAKFESHVIAHAGAVSGAPKRAGRLASPKSKETEARRAAAVAALVRVDRADLLHKPLCKEVIRQAVEGLPGQTARPILANFDGFLQFLKREPDKVRAMIEAVRKTQS